MSARSQRRTWTAVVTVQGHASMAAAWSDRDDHDSQIMQAAHDALRLMAASGAAVGVIDLFRNTGAEHDDHVERRTVSVDRRGIVVSADLMPEILGGHGVSGGGERPLG
jgi:hypothetical protein